jgi:hypothetical protein
MLGLMNSKRMVGNEECRYRFLYLLNNRRAAQVREASNQFRLNRRITKTQRNFLKRLLMSKTSLVVVGFKKLQGLPPKKEQFCFL